jgi:hypothetical protein
MSVYPWSITSNEREDWLSVPCTDSVRKLPVNGQVLQQRTFERMAARAFSDHDVAYIKALSIGTAKKEIQLSADQLEKLRQACQLWDIALHPRQIESHRPFIGFFIVKAKRLVFRLLQVLLKDLIRQQRAFNAAVISSLISMAESEEAKPVER